MCLTVLVFVEGLDPAGPMFQTQHWSVGLNPSCADFVDVIHTDGDKAGLMNPLGHVDFYPNGGEDQRGCLIGRTVNHQLTVVDTRGFIGIYLPAYIYQWWQYLTVSIVAQIIRGVGLNRLFRLVQMAVKTPCLLYGLCKLSTIVKIYTI